MSFTAKDVVALREQTGVGMMDCKKALTEAGGDMEKASDILREKGLAASVKKAGRIAAEGIAYAKVNDSGNVAALVEVNAETDFVAKNAEFQNFVDACANAVIENDPADLEALLASKAPGSDMTIDAMVKDKILTIGENIKVRRFARYDGAVVSYVHGGGRIGVIVKFETTPEIAGKPEFVEYAKNVAMQIAAVKPQYVSSDEVPAEIADKEKAILKEQVMGEGKPEAIAEKIVVGRMGKFYKEICLNEQPYVKDGSMSVLDYTNSVGKELGGDIKILAFTRFEKGEGIEKRSDDFAAEIASMVK